MMLNSSTFYTNDSQISSSKTVEHVKLALAVLIVACFCIFLCFMALILNVFISAPHVRENARYVLFVHMLINDSSYIALGIALLMLSIYQVTITGPTCYLLYTLSMATFRTTAYNLSTMALERYVAICHPLHHGRLCTARRAHGAITLMWLLGSIPYFVDLSLISSSSTQLSSLKVLCSKDTIIVNPIQVVIKSSSLFLGFTIVGLIILCTYIQIILVARKVSSQSSSASRAGRTVMLHAFQLLLCMADLLATLPQTLIKTYIDLLPLINFFLYSCIPRFLSPLIYGLRDEKLKSYVKHTVKRNFIWRGQHQR